MAELDQKPLKGFKVLNNHAIFLYRLTLADMSCDRYWAKEEWERSIELMIRHSNAMLP